MKLMLLFETVARLSAEERRELGQYLEAPLTGTGKLARTMLAEGTLLSEGRLSIPFLRAAVQSACTAGEVDWAADFLTQYADHLVGQDRVPVRALHELMVAYHQKNYGKVLRGSALLRTGAPRFEILQRVLQIKAFYDQDRTEEALRAAETLRKLIRRKRDLGERFAQGYREFTVWVERLGKRPPATATARQDMAAAIRASEAAEMLWLLDRCRGAGDPQS
ncbi:MAG: hypothetical protein AAF998_25225 [Bacteroidota bacterium]